MEQVAGPKFASAKFRFERIGRASDPELSWGTQVHMRPASFGQVSVPKLNSRRKFRNRNFSFGQVSVPKLKPRAKREVQGPNRKTRQTKLRTRSSSPGQRSGSPERSPQTLDAKLALGQQVVDPNPNANQACDWNRRIWTSFGSGADVQAQMRRQRFGQVSAPKLKLPMSSRIRSRFFGLS